MRKSVLLPVILVVIAAGVLLWLQSRPGVVSPQETTKTSDVQPVAVQGQTPPPVPNQAAKPESASGFPDDPRPAVRKFYEFARIAKLYNFDPRVTGYRDETNRFGIDITFGTATHDAEVLNGKLIHVTSQMDAANPPNDRERKSIANWYSCTGTMTEDEAMAATLTILRGINDTRTLEAIQKGKRTFQAIPMHLKDPNGNPVTVIPFRVLRLYDEREVMRVEAEFRMGATGVAGLTQWFNNR